jgi:predicted 2-oxoglutarate/Fe(II)-dependent dioxygenase YbiX
MCRNQTVSAFRQSGFLSPEECRRVRAAMDRGAAEAAEILEAGVTAQPRTRNASLIEPGTDVIDLIETRLESARDSIAASLGLPLGDREGVGFIRYPPGGFYKPHRDRGEDPQWPAAARRAAAVVIFLNSSREVSRAAGDFDGGILRLLEPPAETLVPQAGLLVAFPAGVLHEVTDVRNGTRDTIADWFYFRR